MKRGPLILTALMLAGCVRFHPQPLAPETTAAQLEARRLDDAGLRRFLEQNLGREFKDWPLTTWDLPTLTLAAFYFQPGLAVARAQWRLAQAGEKTAGGRPNPTLTITPGYNTTTLVPSPWSPAINFDIPLETAGKRGKRIAAAEKMAESAHYDFLGAAWKVRADVRASLVDFKVAGRRALFLRDQFAAQQQIVKLLQQRLDVGEISRPELTTAQIALNQTRLELADANAGRAAACSHLAEAVGVSSAALKGLEIKFDFSTGSLNRLTSAPARRIALCSRSDVLGALADYAASEANLRLEIAKQYPDVHLNPGYQYDQGDNKWSVGLGFELPVFNQNRGPIAEAEARRKLSAAKLVQLQAQIITEVDRALAEFRVARAQLKTGGELFAAQQQQQAAVRSQFESGAADRLDLLGARLVAGSAALVQWASTAQMQQALGALENALQQPTDAITAVIEKLSTDDPTGKEIKK
jgi:outer membrane protein TolC